MKGNHSKINLRSKHKIWSWTHFNFTETKNCVKFEPYILLLSVLTTCWVSVWMFPSVYSVLTLSQCWGINKQWSHLATFGLIRDCYPLLMALPWLEHFAAFPFWPLSSLTCWSSWSVSPVSGSKRTRRSRATCRVSVTLQLPTMRSILRVPCCTIIPMNTSWSSSNRCWWDRLTVSSGCVMNESHSGESVKYYPSWIVVKCLVYSTLEHIKTQSALPHYHFEWL